MSIVCRSAAEIEKLARVNALVARVLKELAAAVKPGVTTRQLDEIAEQRLREAGAEPAFKGYHGYPATICASVNEQVVHGIPNDRPMVEGDIVSIDMGAKLDGFFGDSAVTVPVGKVTPEAERLLQVTKTALDRAVAAVKAGARVSDIGAAVQSYVEAQRVFGGPRVRGPRHRNVAPRGAADSELRHGRARTAARRGHGPRD